MTTTSHSPPAVAPSSDRELFLDSFGVSESDLQTLREGRIPRFSRAMRHEVLMGVSGVVVGIGLGIHAIDVAMGGHHRRRDLWWPLELLVGIVVALLCMLSFVGTLRERFVDCIETTPVLKRGPDQKPLVYIGLRAHDVGFAGVPRAVYERLDERRRIRVYVARTTRAIVAIEPLDLA